MLPFQIIEPPPPIGMSPAEAAHRQRQRMLQAGVFVCCLLLLLDTRGTAQQGIVELGGGSGKGSMSPSEQAAVEMRGRLDDTIGSTRRRSSVANVTGLYQGTWQITSRDEWETHASKPAADSGVAVVHLEMMSVDGFSELSAARALVSLPNENGSSDKGHPIFVSAFGIYLHSLGRLIMIANVGNPTKDSVELRVWSISEPKARRNESDVSMLAASRRRDIVPRGNHSLSARTKRLWLSDRMSRRLDAKESAYTTRSAAISAHGIVDGLALELVVEGRVAVSASPGLSARPGKGTKTSVKRTGANFTLDPEPPLQRPLLRKFAKITNASDQDFKNEVGSQSDEVSTLWGDAGGRVWGAFPLKPDRRFAYPARPLGEDVWRKARCAFAVDLEENPAERKPASSTDKLATDELALRLVGTLSGCGLSIQLEARANRIDWDAARRAALGYSLLMTSMCVVQIALLFRQLHFSRTQAVAARVSLICVAAQSLIDAVLCVANLLLCAAVQNLFAAFASVAFFELIIFCVVEMRYVVVVFQAHDPQRFWLGASTRRQLAILHAQFYLALFASLCAVYVCRDDVRLVAFVAYSFWLPQIVRNARHEYTQPFHDSYLYGMALSRLVAPLYVYAYPYSLVSVIVPNAKLRPIFCLVLFAWQAAQVALLKAQAKLGPRFFIPRCFLPARYNYRRPLPPLPPQRQRHAEQALHNLAARTTAYRHGPSPADSLGRANAAAPSSTNSVTSATDDDLPEESRSERGFECVICFQDVLPSGRNHLITPCDHVFHDSCLLQWMQFKLECPVCRSTLPPM